MKQILLALILLLCLPAAAYADGRSETDWLVRRVLEDLRRMAEFATAGKVDFRGRLKPELARTMADSHLTVSGHTVRLADAWDFTSYAELIRKLHPNLQPGAGLPGDDLPGAMLSPRSVDIAAAATNVSTALRDNMADPQAHEDAAFLHAVLVYREAAGRFYDPRVSLCRITAHLAMARALGRDTPSDTGRLAQLILLIYGRHPAAALEPLNALAAKRNAAGRWAQALKLNLTRDWRDAEPTGSIVERIAYFRAVLSSSKGQASAALVESMEAQDESISSATDWHRIFLQDPPTRKFVIASLDRALAMEAAEMQAVWHQIHHNALVADKVNEALNVEPGYSINRGVTGQPEVQVIDWGTWAAFTQRHLCHIFNYVLGRQMLERRFSALTLYPFVLLHHHRVANGLDRDTLKRAIAIVNAQPQLINALNWQHMDELIKQAATPAYSQLAPLKFSPYAAERWKKSPLLGRPPIVADLLEQRRETTSWFSEAMPSDAVYQPAVRMGLVDERRLASWVKAKAAKAPWTAALIISRMRELPHDAPLAEYDAIAGQLAYYDLNVLEFLLDRFEDDEPTRLKLLERVAGISTAAHLAAAALYHKMGQFDKAVAKFNQAIEAKVDPKLLAQFSRRIADYYLAKGEADQAERVMKQAADLGDYPNMRNYLRFLERQGRLVDAEKLAIVMQKKHLKHCPLLAFYVRQSRLNDKYQGSAVVPTILKEIQLTPALNEHERLKAVNLANEIIFPGGKTRLDAQLTSAPRGGLLVKSVRPPLSENIKTGAILAAINGTEILDMYQYYGSRNEILADTATFTLWQDGSYSSHSLQISVWDASTDLRNRGFQPETVADRIAAARNAEGEVTKLDLSRMGLSEVPDAALELKGLQQLDLSWNPLEQIPVKLTGLKFLRLANCNLTTLPDGIEAMKNLETLDLENNRLQTLPETIGALQKLKRLDLKRNQIEALPDAIAQLRDLRLLRVDENVLSTLPANLGGLKSLTILSLGRNRFQEFPRQVQTLPALKMLFLFDNEIVDVSGIAAFPGLTRLDLRNNLLTTLPPEFAQLQLEQLQLDGNCLTAVPQPVLQMTSLKQLGLSGNALATLPNELRQLKNLNYLGISSNRLAELPLSLGAMESLKRIDYGGNDIRVQDVDVLRKEWKDKQLRNVQYD